MRLKTQSQGFSLVELIVVLILLGLIAGFILPNVMGQREGANVRAAEAQVMRLSAAVDNFYLDTGRAPRELRELVEEPGNVSNWNGPYVNNSNLNDPWGNPYQYRFPGQKRDFDIISYGADGAQGGDDRNADISNAN